MTSPHDSLPAASDDAERQVLADIARHGWHVVLVRKASGDEPGRRWVDHPAAQAAYEAEFSYTVGLTYTFRHPEVVLVGGWRHAHAYLNVVGEMVQGGRRFAPGDTTDELLEGFTVRFDPVGDAARKVLLTLADWAVKRRPFAALQLVLPDTNGRWPADAGYDGFPQPSLA